MHRKLAAALVAALALGIASCGGSEVETLTRAQLVRRVEAACRHGQQVAEQEGRASRGSRDTSGLQFVTVLLAGQQAVIERIDNVTTSGAAKGDFETFKQAVQDRVDLLDRLKSEGRDGIARAMRSAQAEGEAVTKRLQAAAQRLGVEGCS